MAKNLVIVESPAKAKTIEKILGEDFTVKSSMGHIRDLAKGDKGVDIGNNFNPSYEVSPDKTKVVSDLKASMKKVDEVWLATDEDREGEAISWHLCEVLGLDPKTTKRIAFREITKSAIQKAIQGPRTVDLNLVDAQQARRILDRLVGFELSSLLWKKVKGKLSAGRVQSVALKLITEREREIKGYQTTPFYKVAAIFNVKNENGRMVELKADLPTRYDAEGDAQAFLEKCKSAVFSITNIAVRPTKRKPTAPFTTSTLQQEASRKLGFSVKRTMTNAQRLYEQGFITYMRTDSVTLSDTALKNIAGVITKNYGANYLSTRQYKNKKSNAQEAHEAIRPSYADKRVVTNDHDQQKLYDLIWKRTVASQMTEAELEKTTVDIGISTIGDATFKAKGEVLIFDGFLKVYLAAKDDDDDDEDEDAKGILPPLTLGQELALNEMVATERFTRPPARFTEAGLVKKLEELGIGRPSTYAPTISRIMEPSRGYVIKGDSEGNPRNYNVLTLKSGGLKKQVQTENTGSNKGRLVATDLGLLVIDFLDKHFKDVMNYSFTAEIEGRFDIIAAGDRNWTEILGEFYHPFHEVVEHTLENAERATGERILGKDPVSGKTLLVRMSRFGPVAQIGAPDELEEDEKPKYANLRGGLSLESVTFEEAVELFKLPRELGQYEDKDVVIGAGRFGPYVKWGEAFISIPKDEDALTLPVERAHELIEEKKKADAPVGTYKGIPYTQGKGRFGPFLKYDEYFVNIPRRFDPENLSDAEAHELIEAKLVKEANRYIQRWDDEKISVQNARWGPIIKFKKKQVKIAKKEDGTRVTPEEAAEFTLEYVKEIIVSQIPDAFKKKTRKKAAPKKKATPKKKKEAAK
jgi:DNA topoisomerase-1